MLRQLLLISYSERHEATPVNLLIIFVFLGEVAVVTAMAANRTAVPKVVGSSPGRTSTQNIKITEDKELPLLLFLYVVKLLRDEQRKPILSGSQFKWRRWLRHRKCP